MVKKKNDKMIGVLVGLFLLCAGGYLYAFRFASTTVEQIFEIDQVKMHDMTVFIRLADNRGEVQAEASTVRVVTGDSNDYLLKQYVRIETRYGRVLSEEVVKMEIVLPPREARIVRNALIRLIARGTTRA